MNKTSSNGKINENQNAGLTGQSRGGMQTKGASDGASTSTSGGRSSSQGRSGSNMGGTGTGPGSNSGGSSSTNK